MRCTSSRGWRANEAPPAAGPPPGAATRSSGDNRAMQIRFTKMQGAGNDFVVLDETRQRLGLSAAQYRFLADRHFGVGADQILGVRPAPAADIDFEYIIHNADGSEVAQCGNGARCLARFVRDKGLSDKDRLRVQTRGGVITLRLNPDGRVSVDMGRAQFEPASLPFDASGLQPLAQGLAQKWPLALVPCHGSDVVGCAQPSERIAQPIPSVLASDATPRCASMASADRQMTDDATPETPAHGTTATVWLVIVSMGNPHAVQLVDDVERAPVPEIGPLIANHARFAQRVNAGFMQVVDRGHVRLRVFERGAGETLACGSGACAAVSAGIRLGLLDSEVQVAMRGGLVSVAWSGAATDSVVMTGPATTVFEGQIELPSCP
ncbi:diaminopimelate epimerase [Verminephrobacter eiseniae]|nr:diaminopimelate epimerase [Verminephrobacter eiseniae]